MQAEVRASDTVARLARLAAELMWAIVGLADPVLMRTRDSAQAAVEVGYLSRP